MSRYNIPAIEPDKRNKSGIPGVCLEKLKDGHGMRSKMYYLGYYNLNGKKYRKNFSISKHGKDEAMRLAIEFRKKGLKKIHKFAK